MHIDIAKAYYVKLGRGGKWEKSSIDKGKIRIGWPEQALADINNGNWPKIQKELQGGIKSKAVATRAFNELRYIAESTPDDVWITFYTSLLWWCRVTTTGIEEDKISKFRKVAGGWSCRDINQNLLIINQIPGTLSKIQRFQGTICRVREKENLRRLLNNQPSETYKAINEAEKTLVTKVEKGITKLHWKDFEILIDLLFRDAGWRRVSTLGETMKDIDLELEEPVTKALYQVQIKSSADLSAFKAAATKFSNAVGFKKLYFVVHTPIGEWNHSASCENVELLLPGRLARMTVESGLVDWLLRKIK